MLKIFFLKIITLGLQKMKRNNYNHQQKGPREKEAYRQFLASKFELDKTEPDSIDIEKTNESSFEEEKAEPTKVDKKSLKLVVKDFFYDHYVMGILTTILGGVAVLIITGYISSNKEQIVQGQKILTIEENVKKLEEDGEKNLSDFNLFKNDFIEFKTGILKDIDVLKNKP